MNTTDAVEITPRAREYLDLWVRFISDHLSKSSHHDLKAEMISIEETPKSIDAKGENGTWFRFAGAGTGEQAFFLDDQDFHQLLQLLGEHSPGNDAEQNLDSRKVVETFFSQVAGTIPLAEWLGSDTKLETSGSDAPGWKSSVRMTYRLSSSQNASLILHALLSSDVVSALQSVHQTDNPEKEVQPAIDSSPLRAASKLVRDIRLELLMDVELEVVLRFGQREMLLRDVLALTPGTILELNQQVQDPVELLVGNKVIAWGDVVTVDGNYGLRITSLASRKERLESLRK